MRKTVLSAVLGAIAWSCAATANPELEDGAAGVPAFAEREPDPAASQVPAAADTHVAVARVAGRDVDVRALLVRAWWRSSNTVREMLEQLVVERLTAAEAARLGLAVDAGELRAAVEDAWIALRARIAETKSGLEPEAFIRRVMGLDPGFYAEQLESDARVQWLLERVVRAWSLASERSVLRILAVQDADIANKVVAELEAGRAFDELARTFGIDETRDLGLERVTVVHDERVELARVARLTPRGEFGGPIEEAGRFLVFEVLDHLEPYGGAATGAEPASRTAFLAAVEADLAAQPVEEIEYLQWRAAMERRYQIDLSPFADLVEGPVR